MRRKLGLIGFLAVLITAMALPAYAGWVEVNSYGGTTYISNGRVKNREKGDDMWTIFDASKGLITMVNAKKRSYTEVEPAKFCDEMSAMVSAMMEEQMKDMPSEQRAMMEQMMDRNRAKKVPRVSVSRKGSGGKVAGFNTVKYGVTVDGRPYKEVWVTEDASIMKDVRKFMKKAREMSAKMSGCMQQGPGAQDVNPEASMEYLSLMEKGWTMKEVRMDGAGVEMEVKSLVEKSIPDSAFRVPSGYRKVEMRQMMEGMLE